MAAAEASQETVRFAPGDRVLVVANPATRRDIRQIVAALRAAAPDGVEIDVRITTRAGEAQELACQHAPGARAIVAVGGDGTVAEVAAGAMRARIPLAIMPGGSTNIIAREMGVPLQVDAGAALLFGDHRLKRIDVGGSDRRTFLHMTGAGFDSRFFARSNSRWKRKVGWVAYLPPAAMALFDRPFEARVVVDGTEVRARSPLVLVANGRSVLHPSMRIAPAISKSDGVFDVFIVTATGSVAKTRVLWRLMTRHLDLSPYVTRLRGSHVELATDPPLPVQFDGDVDGSTPVTLDIIPGALRVITPRAHSRFRTG